MATRTIATDIKLTGEKEFNAGMTAMNSNLKTLKSDMAAVSSEFEDNADSMQALTAKQKILQQSVDQHQAKVDALRQKYEQVKDLYGENSAQADKYKQQLNQATVALNKETAALEKNAAALKQAEIAETTYTPVTQRMANAVSGAKEKLKDFGSEVSYEAHHFPVLGEALDILSAGFKSVSAAGKIATPIIKGAGTAAMAGAKGVATAAVGLAKGVGAITEASVVGVGAIGVAGVVAAGALASMAKEQAEAAKAAKEAKEKLTDQQKVWLEYSNQLDALDASVASAKGALAGVLLPVLSDLSTEGAAFLNDFSRDMQAAAGDTGAQTKVLSDYIVKGAQLIKEKLPEYIAIGKELFQGLIDGLGENSDELFDMGLDLAMQLLDGIIDNAPQLAEAGIQLVQKLTESLVENGPELITAAVGMVTQIIQGLAQAAPDLIPMAAQLVVTLILALIEAAPDLLLAGMELIYGIVSGLIEGLGDIISAADTIISTLVSAFSEKADQFLSVGGDIVKGIWDGISAGTEWIYGKISGWVGDVVGWIKKKLGIQSPSKIMRDEVGYWMARGVGAGWEAEMQNVNRMIANSVNTSFDVPEINVRSRSNFGRNYITGSGKTVNLYFYAKTITEAEINMVVDIVNRKLGDDL